MDVDSTVDTLSTEFVQLPNGWCAESVLGMREMMPYASAYTYTPMVRDTLEKIMMIWPKCISMQRTCCWTEEHCVVEKKMHCDLKCHLEFWSQHTMKCRSMLFVAAVAAFFCIDSLHFSHIYIFLLLLLERYTADSWFWFKHLLRKPQPHTVSGKFCPELDPTWGRVTRRRNNYLIVDYIGLSVR